MKQCPHGHYLTPENLRERWIRGRVYPVRECWTCIRNRRKTRDPEYHRKYMALHRSGKEIVQDELSMNEKELARRWWEFYVNRRNKVQDYRKRRLVLAGLKQRSEELAELEEAMLNPELAQLIREQKADDNYYIPTSPIAFEDVIDWSAPRIRRKTTEMEVGRLRY